MNILERHSVFFHFLCFFFHVLSCSFMFFHVLSCCIMFFHFLSLFFSIFSPSFSLGCSKSFFLHRLPHDFLAKLLCKTIFWAVSGGTPLGPLFFLVYFFIFFHFRFLFQFLSMFFFYFSFVSVKFNYVFQPCNVTFQFYNIVPASYNEYTALVKSGNVASKHVNGWRVRLKRQV